MNNLTIEYVDIDSVQSYANNAKIHNADQIEQIKKSIQEFGMNDPIAVWKNNEIIEGHGRLIACKELGMTTIPVVRLDSLTDEQRRAYMLIHNKLTMNTGFEFSLLSEELQSIADIDMSDFGFGSFEMSTDDEEITPDDYDNEMINEYGEGETKSNPIVLVCESPEEEEFVKGLFKEDGNLKKVYYAAKIMELYE